MAVSPYYLGYSLGYRAPHLTPDKVLEQCFLAYKKYHENDYQVFEDKFFRGFLDAARPEVSSCTI